MFRRRSSDGTNSAAGIDCGYGEVGDAAANAAAGDDAALLGGSSKASSDSDWPDDMSDKESLQSWAKEQQEKENNESDDLLGTKEELHLRRWFLAITVLLSLVGVGVSLFTFYYLKGQEEETFERAFASTAQAIVDSADHHMKVIQQALLGRSQSLTTFSTFTGSLWPFVSIPDFYVSGNNFLLETETEMVAWGPLVKTEQSLRTWEAYSTYMLENSGWFPPAELEDQLQKQLKRLEEQKQHLEDEESKNRDGDEPPDLEFSDANGLYIPLWQLSPWWYNAWINHNLTSQFEDSITLLLRTKQPIWTRFVTINNPYNSSTNYADYNMDDPITVNDINGNITTTTSSSSAPTQANQSVVVSFLFQPVFRAFRDHDVSYEYLQNITTGDDDDVVAIYLVAAIQWDSFLGSLVPEGTPGVDLVVTNPWGQTLTYQVSTDNEGRVTTSSTLVGSGDQHSSDYEDLSTSTNITEHTIIPQNPTQESDGISVAKSAVTNRHPHSVEELKEHGYPDTHPFVVEAQQSAKQLEAAAAAAAEYAYTGNIDMTIFPTFDYENAYTTMEPLTLTLVVAALALIAIFSFFLYSRSVYNRQQKLVETANRTALVVKSLFPSNVRDRIMKEAEELEIKNQEKAKKKKLQLRQSQQQQMDGSHPTISRGSIGSIGGASTGTGGGSIFGELSVGSRYKRRASQESQRSREFPISRKSSLGAENPYGSQPIADHFTATTVMFADMVGFTAWSSVREPVQVFTLLETIYHAFDKVARKRGIFKVETIGDCYVAVCGLPVPRSNHSVAMAYFANDCLRKMNTLTKKLEVTLGPDTGELTMRIGLHSGPVTAGVLRGEKSRFQLFGDTVNTAARMESNGKKDCIHVSDATAKLLTEHGKARWLTLREDRVVAKGKGEMQTYWLEVRSSLANYIENTNGRRSSGESGGANTDLDGSSVGDDSNSDLEPKTPEFERAISGKIVSRKLGDRVQRLVDWNVEQLVKLLKKVVANRKETEPSGIKGSDFDLRRDSNSSILEEATEVIPFPKPTVVDILVGETQVKHENVDLDSIVVEQLHEFMTCIAELYNDNAFHNFAHASHVAMAIITWLSRISPPKFDPEKENAYEAKLSGDWKSQSNPSKDMYALQADPLTHFALVFAALIHDLEHRGVPNAQLVKEKSHTASVYTTSIHEQASVDSAFETLMEDKYAQLRDTLFTTEEEFYRFRQIVINSVLATDILDEKIMAKQFVRWGCLFLDDDDDAAYYSDYEPENEGDQRMSIVVERLLLISDIAHTMQHWYVYRKWNSKLFEESFLAWKAGRAESDPSLTWYENELDFFDTYVIPLATKMKDCELFDASSEDCIAYATSNREQWKNNGKEEVASMVDSCNEIEFEVKDSYNPIQDGKIYSPANGRPRPPPRPKMKKTGMDVSMATFDTVLNSSARRR